MDEIPITYDGDELSLYFNGKYFIETLQVLSSDKVNLYISSEKSPCFIKSNDDRWFYQCYHADEDLRYIFYNFIKLNGYTRG